MKGLAKRGAKGRATAGRPYGHGKSGGDKTDCLARHRGRCRICRHAEREEIEQEFLDWVSPREIAETWKIASYRAIYRHAHAVGLFERRRENRLAALDRIIERVGEVKVTAAAVVAAIRLSAKLDSEENLRGCGGKLGENPPASTAGGAPDFGLRAAAGREFVLSLEGLPRTDAVTGHEEGEGKGTLQRAPTVGGKGAAQNSREELTGYDESQVQVYGQRLVLPEDGRPQVAPTKGNGGSEATGDPPLARLRRTSEGPRVVLGEDGRVAGMAWPWPKGKIAFAQGWRWRRGRGG